MSRSICRPQFYHRTGYSSRIGLVWYHVPKLEKIYIKKTMRKTYSPVQNNKHGGDDDVPHEYIICWNCSSPSCVHHFVLASTFPSFYSVCYSHQQSLACVTPGKLVHGLFCLFYWCACVWLGFCFLPTAHTKSEITVSLILSWRLEVVGLGRKGVLTRLGRKGYVLPWVPFLTMCWHFIKQQSPSSRDAGCVTVSKRESASEQEKLCYMYWRCYNCCEYRVTSVWV